METIEGVLAYAALRGLITRDEYIRMSWEMHEFRGDNPILPVIVADDIRSMIDADIIRKPLIWQCKSAIRRWRSRLWLWWMMRRAGNSKQ
jgi:hypothetical protein